MEEMERGIRNSNRERKIQQFETWEKTVYHKAPFLFHSALGERGYRCIFLISSPLTSSLLTHCPLMTPPLPSLLSLSSVFPNPRHTVTVLCFLWKDDITSVTVFNQMPLSFHRAAFLPVCVRVRATVSVMSLLVLAGTDDVTLQGVTSHLSGEIWTKQRGEGVSLTAVQERWGWNSKRNKQQMSSRKDRERERVCRRDEDRGWREDVERRCPRRVGVGWWCWVWVEDNPCIPLSPVFKPIIVICSAIKES